MVDNVHDSLIQHAISATHIHTINAVGGVVFLGSIWVHMPTLTWYTATVGAVWYTCLAVRQVVQSYQDIRAWLLRWRKK